MTKEVTIINTPELSGIEKSKAEQITSTFEPMAEMIRGFEEDFNKIINESSKEITKETISKAKRLRLDIGKVRIETGKLKDKQKEYIKLEDKAIMGVHNILVWSVKEKEDKLKEIEEFFETQEKIRLDKLQADRVEKLSLYIEDAQERDLSKFEDDEFEALLTMKKKEQEDKISAEKKAEQERIAKEKSEAEERKRIAAENVKLKKEAEDRERLEKIESDKREKEEEERIEKARKDAELKTKEDAEVKAKHESELKAERERVQKIETEERVKREKLEAEIKAKEDAEIKAKSDEKERIQSELNKGDSEKLKDFLNDLELLKTKYVFKSDKNQKMYTDTCGLIDKVIDFIKK